jgi:mono/diheme cytochrome c family protein
MKIANAGLVIGALLLVAGTSASVNDKANAADPGRSAFKGNCISCHGPDGAGTPLGKSIHAPDLRSQDVQKKSDAELVQTIAEGKGDMPSFKRILDPQQVQALVNYVRQFGKQHAQ